MAARPTISSARAAVAITVPPEWFISISAVNYIIRLIFAFEIHEMSLHPKQISRKTYHQAIVVRTNVNRNSSSIFKSDYGTEGPMSDAVSGSNTFPIAPRQTPVELNISAYYADTSAKVTVKAIKDSKYASNKVDIHSVCFVFAIGQDRGNNCPA